MKRLIAIILILTILCPTLVFAGEGGGDIGSNNIDYDRKTKTLKFYAETTKATSAHRYQMIGWMAWIYCTENKQPKTTPEFFVPYPRGKESREWWTIPIYISGEGSYPGTSVQSAYMNWLHMDEFNFIQDYGGEIHLRPRIKLYKWEDGAEVAVYGNSNIPPRLTLEQAAAFSVSGGMGAIYRDYVILVNTSESIKDDFESSVTH